MHEEKRSIGTFSTPASERADNYLGFANRPVPIIITHSSILSHATLIFNCRPFISRLFQSSTAVRGSVAGHHVEAVTAPDGNHQALCQLPRHWSLAETDGPVW